MAITVWYEYGRRFGFSVADSGQNPGVFRPDSAFHEFLEFAYGSGLSPFDGEEDEAADFAYQAALVAGKSPKVRREFAAGYRDALAETRPARRLEAARAR